MSQGFIAFAASHGVEIKRLDDSGKTLVAASDTKDRTIGVYWIFSRTSGHFYIGSSKAIGRRVWTHLNHLRKGAHHCIALQRSFEKYGEGDLLFILAAQCAAHGEALALEQAMLDAAHGTPENYNVSAEAATPFTTTEVQRLAVAGRAGSEKFKAHARAQIAKLQTPEMRAQILAACRASESFKANSRKQGENLRALQSKPIRGTHVATGAETLYPSAAAAMVDIGARTSSSICLAVKSGAVAYGRTWRPA